MTTKPYDLIRWLFLSLWLIALDSSPAAAESWAMDSPQQNLHLEVELDSIGQLYYRVDFLEKNILRPSALGLKVKGDVSPTYRLLSVDTDYVRETWTTYWGVKRRVRNEYRAMKLRLQEQSNKQQHLTVEFRAYDDGIAYRYHVPDTIESVEIMSECGEFRLASNGDCWWAWADYNTLEKSYRHDSISVVEHAAAPFTLRLEDGIHLSLLEAAVDDYSTMTLKRDSLDSLNFQVNLVPWADGVAVKSSSPFHTPWRAAIISPDAAGLLTSDLVLNLNDPPSTDFSWVRPLKYVGIWWEMHLGLSTWRKQGGRHGATTENTFSYIDFAEKHGLNGVLVEGWNTGWEHWGTPQAFDFTTPYADFDLQGVARYATAHHVELIGHHETGGDLIAYESRIDSAFSLYRSLGIRYVKTGYAGPVNPATESHHGQYMVKHLNTVMRKAAEYQIMLDVHEPVIPSGLSRTYPNLMTFEAVRGMEWNAWSDGNYPSHTCILPFTRGLAGPIDYTPGIFDIDMSQRANERVTWNGKGPGETAVHSTLSSQLALMVVNYSPMQMAADLPANYEAHPAFRFIENLPTTYDEIRILAAEIGSYVVVARRNGDNWFVGGITNEQARDIELDLSFLDSNRSYRMETCYDTPSTDFEKNPETYEIHSGWVDQRRTFILSMARGGGGVIYLYAAK